jgi:hypothetical protein
MKKVGVLDTLLKMYLLCVAFKNQGLNLISVT